MGSIERKDLQGSETFILAPFSLTSADDVTTNSKEENFDLTIEIGGSVYETGGFFLKKKKEDENFVKFETILRDNNIVKIHREKNNIKKTTSLKPYLEIKKGDEVLFKFSRDGKIPEADINTETRLVQETYIVVVDKNDLPENSDRSAIDSTIDSLKEKLNNIIFPRLNMILGTSLTEKEVFSQSSTVTDDKLTILLSSRLNDAGIPGFFSANDLLEYHSITNPTSNEQQILYLAIPDTNIPEDKILANFVHEYQHMVNYEEHVLRPYLNGTNLSPKREATFLDEGLSVLLTDLVGYGDRNFSYVYDYLNSSDFVISSGIDSTAQRGGAYLFLRYLFEKEGAITYSDKYEEDISGGGIDFVRSLISSDKRGMSNIASVMFTDFDELFARFLATLVLDGSGLNSKFEYNDEALDPFTNQVRGINLKKSDGTSNERTIDEALLSIHGPTLTNLPSSGTAIEMTPGGAILYNVAPSATSFEVIIKGDDAASLGLITIRTN
jgi:hypothetical protein